MVQGVVVLDRTNLQGSSSIAVSSQRFPPLSPTYSKHFFSAKNVRKKVYILNLIKIEVKRVYFNKSILYRVKRALVCSVSGAFLTKWFDPTQKWRFSCPTRSNFHWARMKALLNSRDNRFCVGGHWVECVAETGFDTLYRGIVKQSHNIVQKCRCGVFCVKT